MEQKQRKHIKGREKTNLRLKSCKYCKKLHYTKAKNSPTVCINCYKIKSYNNRCGVCKSVKMA